MSSQRPPERSRNAKAQARHRAKRKAYIEHLEQTVQKLQLALGFSDEEVVGLPCPQSRIKELEEELDRVKKEFAAYRSGIPAAETTGLVPLEHTISRRSTSDEIDHDYSGPVSDNSYLVCPSPLPSLNSSSFSMPSKQQSHEQLESSQSHHHLHHQGIQRPPPLSIPSTNGQVHHHHHGGQSYSAHPSTSESTSNPLYARHSATYQIPGTPSGSSETSSNTPPFSPASAVRIQHQSQLPIPVSSGVVPVAHQRHNPMMDSYHHHQHHSGVYSAPSVKTEEDLPQPQLPQYSSTAHHHHHHHHHHQQNSSMYPNSSLSNYSGSREHNIPPSWMHYSVDRPDLQR